MTSCGRADHEGELSCSRFARSSSRAGLELQDVCTAASRSSGGSAEASADFLTLRSTYRPFLPSSAASSAVTSSS
jgi:hypothetical protein